MARFKPGQSGNPAGKPRGAVSKTTKLRQSIEKNIPEILAGMVEQAKQGDVQASRLLLERCLPSLRPVDVPTPIPLGETLTQNGQAIVSGLSAGKLGANQAAQLLTAIGTLAKIQEVDELTRRVEQLEKARSDEH